MIHINDPNYISREHKYDFEFSIEKPHVVISKGLFIDHT